MSTKLGTILADFTTALSTDIAVGGTTATLSSATDDDGVALPSGRYFFTLDGSNSSKEHISCDLVGTALTNIKSLSRQGVETTGAVRKHRIGTSVSLTDFGHIKFINDLIAGTTTLNASAPLGYDGAPASLTGNQLATVTYVLGVVNGGTVTFDKQIISGQTSGEALTVNDIVYFKEADAKWYKVDADLTATFDQLQMGVAQSTVAINTSVTIGISGPMSGFTGLTAGSKYYASNTPGEITTSAGTNSVFVGWALSTTILLFDSVGKTLPTQKEKDALVGSQGTPSTTNKYITQDNTTSAGTDQSQTTQNSDIATGESNTTNNRNKVAQSFIPLKSKIRGISLWKTANTGTFTGTITVSIQADTAGSPSGTVLLTKTITNGEYNGLAIGEFDVMYSSEISITIDSRYWVVIETSTSDSSNHPNIGTNSAGGYTNGSVKSWNTVDGWTTVSTVDLYFKTYEGINSQVVVTDTTGRISSKLSTKYNPYPFYHENNSLDIINSTAASILYGITSNKDGSVMYTASGTNTGYIKITRFEKDSAGLYFVTHTKTTTYTANSDNSYTVGLAISNDKLIVYNTRDNGGNIVNVFYLPADTISTTTLLTFSGGTTLPYSATGSAASLFSDGSDIFFYNSNTTQYQKYTLSGTVLTYISNYTSPNGTRSSIMFDGNYFYSVSEATSVVDRFSISASTMPISNSITRDFGFYDNTGLYNYTTSSPNIARVRGIVNCGDSMYLVYPRNIQLNIGGTITYKVQMIFVPVSKP